MADAIGFLPFLLEKLNLGSVGMFPGTAAVTTVVAAYVVTDDDFMILADASAGAFDVSLPAAALERGRTFVIIKADSSGNAVGVVPFGSNKIETVSSKSLTSQGNKVILTSDGSATWWDQMTGST
jgi:hypothetical protein